MTTILDNTDLLASLDDPRVSDDDIRQLQDEAREHGDDDMVEQCEAALNGVIPSRAICERAILDARAMDDGE